MVGSRRLASVRSSPEQVKRVLAGVSETNATFMAASIAYHAFVSLVPLLVLAFFLLTLVGDESVAAEAAAATEGFLPEGGQLMVEDAIAESPASAGSSIVGLVVLLWGSLKVFRGMDTAFAEIYGASGESSFLGQLRDAVIVFGAIGVALLAASAASLVFAFVPGIPFLGAINALFLVVVLALAFVPMYYFFPDVDVSVRDVLPGVVVAAVGWTALQSLFQLYVSFASGSESAGPIGAILLLLTWLYVGGLVVLVGAVVNAVGSGHLAPVVGDERAASREPFVDDDRRARERLADRLETVERERDLLRNDAAAQRRRRYRLEDRVDDLEERARAIEAENERLRRELETQQTPPWRRRARGLLGRVGRLRVGTVKRE